MLEQGGLIERISMSSAKVHDLESSRKMLESPYHIKKGDTLVYDRGYIDRHILNKLKNENQISVIVPAKKNMDIFQKALKLAKEKNCWESHPNSKRKGQKICLIEGLGGEWATIENVWKKIEKENEEDVELNVCVIQISKNNKQETEEEITQVEKEYRYIVLISSDTQLSASEIIRKI